MKLLYRIFPVFGWLNPPEIGLCPRSRSCRKGLDVRLTLFKASLKGSSMAACCSFGFFFGVNGFFVGNLVQINHGAVCPLSRT